MIKLEVKMLPMELYLKFREYVICNKDWINSDHYFTAKEFQEFPFKEEIFNLGKRCKYLENLYIKPVQKFDFTGEVAYIVLTQVFWIQALEYKGALNVGG